MPPADTMRSVEQHPVVAVLGKGVVPAETPLLRADDLGVLRGDGVFETIHVRHGEPWLLAEHLDRMAGSAAILEIPLPPRVALEELAAQTLDGWPSAVEGAFRIICTRGPEHGDGTPTVFATLSEIGPERRGVRRAGVSVVTAALGYAVGAREEAPWLLGGAKTLSYAVNMASMRHGGKRGADEVLWVSADGYALEAPTASLVWLEGDELCTVPPRGTGILAGITVRYLLDHAGELGWRTAERLVRPDDLAGKDGAWLTSSVRGLVAIRSLDGRPFPSSPHTGELQKLLGYPV
jgi:4-amino-4-deoxychorismate lyase